jgi:hypothetical protein
MVLESDEERELDEEEKAMLKRGMINWNELKSWRFWIRKEWICEFSRSLTSVAGVWIASESFGVG